MNRGFTELIAKDVRTRSRLNYLRGVALGLGPVTSVDDDPTRTS